MELQVLNADDEPPNARQTNLQGKETVPGREEAQKAVQKQPNGAWKRKVRNA